MDGCPPTSSRATGAFARSRRASTFWGLSSSSVGEFPACWALLALIGLLAAERRDYGDVDRGVCQRGEAPFVRAAIAGVVPATVGLGLLLSYTMVRPLLDAARREGRANTVLAAALLVGSTLLAAMARIPVLAILWGAGVLSGLAQWRYEAVRGRPDDQSAYSLLDHVQGLASLDYRPEICRLFTRTCWRATGRPTASSPSRWPSDKSVQARAGCGSSAWVTWSMDFAAPR